jgi:hypothetical protein
MLYVFTLSRRQNCVNSSRADSRVSCLKTSDVSETHFVAILKESVYKRRIWYDQPDHFPQDGDGVCLRNVGGF